MATPRGIALVKLAITSVATMVLLIYTQTLGRAADAAAEQAASSSDLRALGFSPALHASLALLLLIAATVLGVYKPRGMTRYGQRRQHAEAMRRRSALP